MVGRLLEELVGEVPVSFSEDIVNLWYNLLRPSLFLQRKNCW